MYRSFVKVLTIAIVFFSFDLKAENSENPIIILGDDFHKERRDALREMMPKNSVAVFFANPVRNRSNDVDYIYHQDPNFYYLSGYTEPHAVLLVFKTEQKVEGNKVNDVIFVQKKDKEKEMWTGKRMGVEGAIEQLGFDLAYNGDQFKYVNLDWNEFDKILVEELPTDIRNTKNPADLYDLVETFRIKSSYDVNSLNMPKKTDKMYAQKEPKFDSKLLKRYMASLREIKTEEEIALIKKAVEISAVGQLEMMKAMHPDMSELEAQGVHEFVYRKYGAAHEGYPSIVGAGHNGCILHYEDNAEPMVGDSNLVLMDLGAEYHYYTADVTRTIPSNGKFTDEQRAIYDIVYEAQEAGIAEYTVGNSMYAPRRAAQKVINEGLFKLGIISSVDERHNYLPHGTTHHIGLDVHDPGNYDKFAENMIVTMEPGIYIPEGSPCDEKWWGIAVRIEDDILVTKDGPVNLSAMAPRTSEAIEEAMKQESILNSFILPALDD